MASSKNNTDTIGFIASDHKGYALKEQLKKKFNLKDLGTDNGDNRVDYPDYANALTSLVLKEKKPGILICGTGIGMSIAANRKKGIRAALCHSVDDAKTSREHNDANVLTLNGVTTSPKDAENIAKAFFSTPKSGDDRYARRNKKLDK